MPHKHNHVHRRQLDFGDSLASLEDELASPFTAQKKVVTVYKTETPDGWAGGALTTLERSTSTKVVEATTTSTAEKDSDATPTSSTKSTAKETTEKSTATTAKETSETTSAKAKVTSSSSTDDDSLPTAIAASTAATGSDISGVLAMATETSSSSSSALSTTAASSTNASAASATSASSSSSSGSSDSGTKAGIAIGVLAGVFVVLAMVYFVIRKRKRQMREEQQVDNEKLGGPESAPVSGPESQQAPVTPAKAPRLSLRPMTQLFMGAQAGADRRVSKGPQQSLTMMASPTAKRALGADLGERPPTSESQNVHNPFGNHAETVVEEPGTPRNPTSPTTLNSEMSTQLNSPTFAAGLTPAPRASAMTTDSAVLPPTVTNSSPRSVDAAFSPLQANPVGQAAPGSTSSEATAVAAGAAGAALGAAAVSGLQRKQSVRKENGPAPLDLTIPPKISATPPSPTGTEFSVHETESGSGSPSQPSAGAAAIAAAGGPANSTVHRIQLDFKPTMDDELELQAGQLIRLLHEYDDGWALCIRLDRSQQGVVPRTCLSTRPVKPRPPQQAGPRGPPGNPQGRPRGPSVSSQRGPGPKYPPGNRPMGPPGGPPPAHGPAGRPRGPSVSSQRGPGPNYPPGNRPMGPPGRPGPPMGPGPRPQSPGMPRPQSPGMPRPQSPGMGRPQSPAGQRSQSPGPQGRPGRAQSPSGMNRRHTPPGPSNMNKEYRPNPEEAPQGQQRGSPQEPVTRKPVPGQAY